ncbi:LysR family transcriptional regulator [Indioceanicola profundi]|uniref:LysR family transcriptional regulator n=1 Tax=Indioceanicola profundi TaxID=2220096 RepID=UPI000E6ADFAB|nr:LysR family transcriptional regulator [Indioceanicola profundi]
MDRIDAMRVFCRVAETRSFTKAAADLELPRSTVTDVVKRLEAQLGVRLLDRSTRVVAPTLDGEAWYRQCVRIVADVEEAEAAFRGENPEGELHVNAHGTLARHFILPGLPDFLDHHPGIRLTLSEGDRLVDLVREGVDCVVRVGEPADSDLIARRLGSLPEITAASPDYLERYGTPTNLDDLHRHRAVGFLSSRTGAALAFEFTVGDRTVERAIQPSILMTSAESLVSAARLGLGIVQVPRYHLSDDLASGQLVEILPDLRPNPSPVCTLYPRDRQLSPRVRVFLDWLGRIDFGGEVDQRRVEVS